jgi:hypothetical protein
MNINPNIPPPNGYVFRDTDGTLLKATGWRELERKVVAYRKQTGGNVDDVMPEIIRQVCETTPDYCKRPGEKSNGNRKVGNEYKSKIIRYLAMIGQAKQARNLRYVQDSEADQRIKKCLGCPHRTHVDIGCQSCKNSISKLKEQCLGGKKSRSPALGLCKLSECDLSVAVHVCENKEPNGNMPNYCWRKQK